MREAVKSVVEWLGDAPWLNRRRLLVYPKLFLLVYVATYAGWLAAGHGLLSAAGKPVGVDFLSFWTAGAAALQEQAPAAYNLAQHHALEQSTAGARTFVDPWYYPPTFLLVVLPFAMLPYLWALVAWTAVMLAAYVFAVRKLAPRREALWLAIAFPGALVNLVNGQNGLLVVAMLGGALMLLEERPLLAGTLLGLLSFKPQLGLLIPIALLVATRWRALFAAAATSILFAAASVALFGIETWRAFVGSLDLVHHMVVEHGGIRFSTMQTAFAATRMLGGGIASAYAVQAVFVLAAAVVVIWSWRQSGLGLTLKAAALVVGILLAALYALYYDLILLGLPIAWLALEGERSGFLRFEKTLLAAAWLLPIACEPAAQFASLPLGLCVELLLMAAIVRRSRIAPDSRTREQPLFCTSARPLSSDG